MNRGRLAELRIVKKEKDVMTLIRELLTISCIVDITFILCLYSDKISIIVLSETVVKLKQ